MKHAKNVAGLSFAFLTMCLTATPAFAGGWVEVTEDVERVHGVSFDVPSKDIMGQTLAMKVEYKNPRGATRYALSYCSIEPSSERTKGIAFVCTGLSPIEITVAMVEERGADTHFDIPLLSIREWEANTGNTFVSTQPANGPDYAALAWVPIYWPVWPFVVGWVCQLERADIESCDQQCAPLVGTASVEENHAEGDGVGHSMMDRTCDVTCTCSDGEVKVTSYPYPGETQYY